MYILHIVIHLTRGPNFHPFRSPTSLENRPGCRKSEMHWIASAWLWTLNCQNILYTLNYLRLRRKFSSVSLYNHSFWRFKVVENRKCTEWPQTDLEHLKKLAVESILYTLNAYPRGSNFHGFGPITRTNLFRDIRLRKIGNELHDLTTTLNTYLSNVYPVYTEFLLQGPKFSFVSLYNEPFWRYKVVENRKCTEWPQTMIT